MTPVHEEAGPRRLQWKRILIIAVLVALPVVLYFVIAAQVSWRPRTLVVEQSPVVQVRFSPDGALLATETLDGRVKLWNVATRTLHKVVNNHSPDTYSLVFSPDGKTLAGYRGFAGVRLCDTITGKLKGAVQIVYRPTAEQRRARAWQIARRKKHGRAKWRAPELYPRLVDFSADSRMLYVVDSEDRIQVWDIESSRLLSISPPLKWLGRPLAFTPDKTELLGYNERQLDPRNLSHQHIPTLWQVPAGQQHRSIKQTYFDYEFGAMTVSPNGRWLAIAGYDGKQLNGATAVLYDRKTLAPVARYRHDAAVRRVVFSRDSRMLACAFGGGEAAYQITLRDLHSNTPPRTIDLHYVRGLDLSPDGSLLATAKHDGSVQLWRIK